MSTINRLGNNGFDFSVSKSGRSQKSGASAAPGSNVQGTAAKSSSRKNEDILNISSVVGSAGGAVTQLNLSGSSSIPPTVAVNALKGAASQMSKEQRGDMAISEMARQLVEQMFAA